MRLRTMNRRRWRKTHPPHVTQTEQARTTFWHISKLFNVWSGRRKRFEEAESALEVEEPRYASEGIVIL